MATYFANHILIYSEDDIIGIDCMLFGYIICIIGVGWPQGLA